MTAAHRLLTTAGRQLVELAVTHRRSDLLVPGLTELVDVTLDPNDTGDGTLELPARAVTWLGHAVAEMHHAVSTRFGEPTRTLLGELDLSEPRADPGNPVRQPRGFGFALRFDPDRRRRWRARLEAERAPPQPHEPWNR